MTLTHRRATRADIAHLEPLVAAAIDRLQRPFLDAAQVSASRSIMSLDPQLIDDGTYYVVEIDGVIAGCGGWSRRSGLYRREGDGPGADRLLDPGTDAANVRAMYTHPDHARRGVGRRILEACERDAADEGYQRLELMATRAGRPLYDCFGFDAVEDVIDESTGVAIPLTRMVKTITADHCLRAPHRVCKPHRLRRGDLIAVVSLGWGGPHVFPDVFDAGVETLRRLGCEVVEFPTARRSPDALRNDPRGRAADLNAAFADPGVAGIVTSIGGDDSARILPYLDADTIGSNPKVLMGYSDTTAQLLFAHQLGLITYHGPTVMAGLAQAGHFPELESHITDMLFAPRPNYEYRPFPQWVAGYEDWSATAHPTAIGETEAHDGWHWVNDGRRRPGRLVGGSFEVLEFLKATPYWPEPERWDDRILFLETSEGVPTPEQVRFWLFNYGVAGIFQRINALLIGRPRGYTREQVRQLDEIVYTVVADEFGATHLPIVTNMDFGHTDPQWILPIGCTAEVDPTSRSFRLLEPSVA